MRTSLSLALSATRRSLSSVHDVPLWIDGRAVSSSRTFGVRHPVSHEAVSQVSTCDELNLYVRFVSRSSETLDVAINDLYVCLTSESAA